MPEKKTIKHSHVGKLNHIADTLRLYPHLFNYQFLAYDSALNCFQTLGAGGCETLDMGRNSLYPNIPSINGYQLLRHDSRASTPLDTKYIGHNADSCATPAQSPAPKRAFPVLNPPPISTGPMYPTLAASAPPILDPEGNPLPPTLQSPQIIRPLPMPKDVRPKQPKRRDSIPFVDDAATASAATHDADDSL